MAFAQTNCNENIGFLNMINGESNTADLKQEEVELAIITLTDICYPPTWLQMIMIILCLYGHYHHHHLQPCVDL